MRGRMDFQGPQRNFGREGGDGNVCFLNCSDSSVGIYPWQSSLRFWCAFLLPLTCSTDGLSLLPGAGLDPDWILRSGSASVLWFLGHCKLMAALCWGIRAIKRLWLPWVCALDCFQRNSVRLAAKNLSLAVITAYFFGKWWNGQAPTLEFYIILFFGAKFSLS